MRGGRLSGFIVNRILLPMINEAVYALYEGVGNVESIDKAMRMGANHRMGRLNLLILSGWIRVFRLCRFYMTGWATPNTGLARFWSNMSKPGGLDARPVAAFMTIPAKRQYQRVRATR